MSSVNLPPGPAASTRGEPGRAAILRECGDLFAARVGAAMREVLPVVVTQRALADEAVAAFERGLRAFFDQNAHASGPSGFEQAKHLTASKINLLDQDDLEFSIGLGEVGRRLGELTERELFKVSQRMATLLGRDELAPANDPIGPEAVCSGLRAVAEAVGGSLQSRVELLRAVEQRLGREMIGAYAALSELLVRRNVPAATPSRPRGEDRGARAQADSLEQLQRLMVRRQLAAGGGIARAGQSVGTQVTVDVAQVLGALTQLQRAGTVSATGAESGAPAKVLRELESGGLGASIAGLDAPALDVVAALFDALFDDPQIPDAVKAELGRLQIPVLKVAMLDRSFFAEKAHPARQFLDGVARAAIGLERDAGHDHPACRRVQEAVARVQDEFESDMSAFERALGGLDTGIAEQAQQADAASERYTAFVAELESEDIATDRAHAAVAAAREPGVPRVIHEFLEREWVGALKAAFLQGGEQGAAWERCSATVGDLLWSVRPKYLKEERTKFLALLPDVLRRLNAGLDLAGVDAAARESFMDRLVALHSAAIRPGLARPEPDPAQPEAASAAAEIRIERAQQAGVDLLTVRLSGPVDPGAGAPGIRRGEWVEFRLADGAPARGRLAWIGPARGTLLFTNPAWDHAISVAPEAMAEQIRRGDARIVTDESFFDRAAGRALAALREPAI